MAPQELGFITNAYIGGKWRGGSGGTFPVENPSTGEVIAKMADCNATDVNEAIDAASAAFQTWKNVPVKERSALLLKIQVLLMEHRQELAKIITLENGKSITEALGEVGFAASFFEWFAGECRREYGDTIPSAGPGKRMMTIKQPCGVAALITPWNFPIGMIGRKVAAALAAGCTCVLKPAEDTPLIATAVVKICEFAGVPPGVINVVPCSRDRVQEVGAALCDCPIVRVLSFTGSTNVGQWLYSRCGPTVKKLSLELGGNAPFIVFPSADLDIAITGAMAGKFRNMGQACVSLNRIYVHESLHDAFVNKLSQAMDAELKVGDGLTKGVNQGPLINRRQLDRLRSILEGSVKSGAKIVKGGKSPKGLFFEPTIVTNVTPDMSLFKEEIFGPIAAIMKFKTEEEVIKLANDCNRGLAGYFYTENIREAWRVSEALEVGMVGVNETLFSTCEAPFGGVKFSGFGYEGSKHGLDDYTSIKYVCYGNIL